MESKTYYMILGVSSTESDTGIRAAYRDLAKRLHPDVAGEQATRSFQEISEAYSVLSDPQRRSEYNHKLNGAGDDGRVSSRWSPPEPLVSEPVTIFRNREHLRPSVEAMYDRFLRSSTGIRFPTLEHCESFNLELLLTPEEAARGCVLPVGVPVFTRCSRCRGSGHHGVFACADCDQQGMIENEKWLQIRIPPVSASGSIYEVALQGVGIHNLCLRLHVFVEAQPG